MSKKFLGFAPVFAALVLVASFLLTCSEIAEGIDCTFWKTQPLQQTPPWYNAGNAAALHHTRDSVANDFIVREYLVSDTSSVVLIKQKSGTDQFDEDSNYVDTYFHSKLLWITDRDTLVLDEDLHDISDPSFDQEMSRFVYFKVSFQGQESNKGNVLYCDLRTFSKVLLHVSIGASLPVISPDGNYVLYSDYGDLYLCDLDQRASQLVFRGGGSYLMGTGCIDGGTAVEGILWHSSSLKAVFKFSDSWNDKEVEIREVYWSQ